MRNRFTPFIFNLSALLLIASGCSSMTTAEEKSMERFAPPPSKPNCVSSVVDSQDSHYIAPLAFQKSPDEARAALRREVEQIPRVQLITEDGNYLHYVFRSAVFGFPDDVEFRVDRDKKLIQVRSASRKGSYDFGVNKKRIETLRQQLAGKI